MADLLLGHADYHRSVAKEARIQTLNRYHEQDPVLNGQNAAMLTRPGMRRWIEVGAGPVRGAVYSQPGSFAEAAFVVSGNSWYRVDLDGTTTLLTAGVKPGTTSVRMAATGALGSTPEYLFMADGRNLWLYIANGYARGTLTGTPADNDVVKIGTVYYKFTSGSVGAGTPDGTVTNPWLVALGAASLDAMTNLGNALRLTGEAGVDYTATIEQNADAELSNFADHTLDIRALAVGALGNAVATTETGAALAWGAATLTGGGMSSVTVVETPDNIGAISVGYIASYVVVIPAQGEGINGRFWWINPGETTIDPLDFATAERAPDPVFDVVVFGDQFWLPGASTTEVWYFTGDPNAPVLRLQGVTFDRGTWEGTALQIKESMIIVDNDGGVFQISGGLVRISDPSIEERIREAIAFAAFSSL